MRKFLLFEMVSSRFWRLISTCCSSRRRLRSSCLSAPFALYIVIKGRPTNARGSDDSYAVDIQSIRAWLRSSIESPPCRLPFLHVQNVSNSSQEKQSGPRLTNAKGNEEQRLPLHPILAQCTRVLLNAIRCRSPASSITQTR